ncbi:AAA domain-containing protein [Carbonactinospora thermoautotrophica]|uniref:AAA domain-containing protein n=1 Tax=Carbonactinospora thermoautotrophica TaxID=1469144 RepID=UPI003DA8C505
MREEPDALVRDATGLFEFLIDLQGLKTRPVRSLDAYLQVLWLDDLPHDPRIATPLSHPEAEGEHWVVADRVERAEPPAPGPDLAPWLNEREVADFWRDRPELRQVARLAHVEVGASGERLTGYAEHRLDDHPEVRGAYARWLPAWQAWAESERAASPVVQAYRDLYLLRQQLADQAETYELLLGFGLLTGEFDSGQVRRHLVTIRGVVDLDHETGRITVSAAEGAEPVLEEDMLDPADRVPGPVREQVLALLRDPEATLWGSDSAVARALQVWVNGHGPDTGYDDALRPPHQTGRHPRVTLAPALLLRKRGQRSFTEAFDRIKSTVLATREVPAGIEQLLRIEEGAVSEAALSEWQQAFADQETYFPRESNEEQRQVVARLRERRVVLVQGPPGTGKTHTIANLVTDLLAHGQRVLITSHTARALKVLKEQLPDEIQELCVSRTDETVKGRDELESSVRTILARHSDNALAALEKETEQLRERLSQARRRRARAAQQLREIQEAERGELEVGGYRGTLSRIAERLRAEEAELGWLGPVADPTMPFSVEDAVEFRRLLRAATPELRSRAGSVLDEAVQLSPDDFRDLAERIRQARESAAEARDVRDTPLYQAVAALSQDNRQQLGGLVTELLRRLDGLATRPEPWVRAAVTDVLQGRGRTLRQRHQDTAEALRLLAERRPALDGRLVTGLDRFDLGIALGHVHALREHLAAGKKLRGPLGMKSKVLKQAAEFLETVRVDGARCETLELVEHLYQVLDTERVLRPVEDAWSITVPVGSPLGPRAARLEDEQAVLGDVLALGDTLERLRSFGTQYPAVAHVDWASREACETLLAALDAAEREDLRREVEARLEPLQRALEKLKGRPDHVPAVPAMLAAVADLDPDRYTEACRQMALSREANEILRALDYARDRISKGHASLADQIEADPDDPAWDARLPKLAEAWAWSACDERLRRLTDPAAERRWMTELSEAEAQEKRALKELAANLGWAHCLRRLDRDPEQSWHLKAYAQEVRRLGKGTGKYAARHRRQAQEHLEACQQAVPAWIMPLHQVVATVPMDRPDLFDVVIVDEASQSGLEALLLFWLAPRVVVVGDDQQISPEEVGLEQEQVYQLRDRYLAGVPTKTMFAPRTSLFDVAERLAGSRIMLREHFRCMPEIIGFSNGLCYDGKLLPLRQYGADRLPPVRTTFVPGAFVSGSSSNAINETEAEALVEQVVECCADPAYAGKTMGVITLLGNAQTELIDRLLVDRLGVDEVEARGLRVGNSEAFQGDQRDVIFVSMVVSPDGADGPRRIGPMTKETDKRRINVAASRARDQVWLFHSVRPGDLHADDYRRRWLQYATARPAERDVYDIGEVLPDKLREPFDSLFEQRVYLALRERGYRVRPQYEVGPYRIDLVVEGSSRRLAVECDGDAYHGPDREAYDESRQRELERLGWVFERIRGSRFFRNPHEALVPVWAKLDELGIEPLDAEPA